MSCTIIFKDRRVLITGGARGIGLAIAKKFVESEAQVFILDQDEAKLEEVKKLYPTITTICVDLLDWNKSREVIQEFGPFHHLVNNAGICRPAELFLEIKPESIDGLFNVNLKAMVNVGQVVAKGMIEQRLENATIVNMSSISDTVAVGGLGMYSCTKAAVTMLTKVMALELGAHSIRVNCVRPAMVKTENVGVLPGKRSDIFENVLKVNDRKVIKRMVEMTEVADAVLFLSSTASSMTTGSDLLVDGGLFTC